MGRPGRTRQPASRPSTRLPESRLYRLGRSARYHNLFHDITRGNNAYILKVRQLSYVIPGYQATSNWDPATGLGTPRATPLLQAMYRQRSSLRSVPVRGVPAALVANTFR
ncbi:hypothetical protein KDW_59050 [Dictyobacter vulcani]|uniref:Uncharacterized protein n=1 Tax=Dictyobacter vulcani TaxID=2607529 RepID=A0A5J4KW64_9CHLR|nr:hypothetical protein KDW_59050 [Dictyobacter vulcani]